MRGGWRRFGDFLGEQFPGKVQKLAINIGGSCPNRDGTLGVGGCSYCNNAAFVPGYCLKGEGIIEQIERGKSFFGRKYKEMSYLAYFQAYTSTYGFSEEELIEMFKQACGVEGVKGVIVGTRPDCVSGGLVARMARELPWAMMEYGAETSHDATLRLVNRGHTWSQVQEAVRMTASEGVPVGLHLIMGLPSESEQMMLQTIDRVNDLPVSVVKIHRLQVLTGSRLSRELQEGRYEIMRGTVQDYARLCLKIIDRLRPGIAIDRFVSSSPPGMVEYPAWGMKNYEFANLLEQLRAHGEG